MGGGGRMPSVVMFRLLRPFHRPVALSTPAVLDLKPKSALIRYKPGGRSAGSVGSAVKEKLAAPPLNALAGTGSSTSTSIGERNG